MSRFHLNRWIWAGCWLLSGILYADEPSLKGTTFCNPVNVEYNFQQKAGHADSREAADPEVFVFKGTYYLFASKSWGYWWSTDMGEWHFVKPKGLDVASYAPAVFNIGDTVYYTPFGGDIYKTSDLKGGVWTKAASAPVRWNDPSVLVDDDGKVYAYYGCSPQGSITGLQIDPANDFQAVGRPVVCLTFNGKDHGFEDRGENNEMPPSTLRMNMTWLEGSWITKHAGKYYLQYSVPGTQERSYCNGCYVADKPLGPYTFCPNSPVTAKWTGFVTGLGHGSIFQDLLGNYWAVDTVTISKLARFERRVAIFPVEFDKEGLMHSESAFCDYPQYLPGKAPSTNSLVPDCMLLSWNKKAMASSCIEGHVPASAFNEDIKTWWSATTADPGEWLMVDLGSVCDVRAIQVNFAEQDAEAKGDERSESYSHKYKIEGAPEAEGPFHILVDKSTNDRDVPHDYDPLDHADKVRFVRITNEGPMPAGGKFAIRDLRIFGTASVPLPKVVQGLRVNRPASDPKTATIDWKADKNAEGYVIRFGIAPDKLYNEIQVWGGDVTEHVIHCLCAGVPTYFRIDAYNTAGVTPGTVVVNSDKTTQ